MYIQNNLTQPFVHIYDNIAFLKVIFKNLLKKGFEWDEFFKQSYLIGYRSIGIVSLTGFILGFVLTLQSQPTLKQFGATGYIPGMVSVSVIREIGPVIVALICAGKMASSIGAELGSMNVTEQIAAMEVSGANPIQFLVIPRVLATTLMVPLLTIFADCLALIGGFVASNLSGEMSPKLYFIKSFYILDFADIVPSLIKTTLFGFTVGFVGCYKGFNSNQGTASVGMAANSAVVTSSVCIIIIDAIVVQITNSLIYS